MYLSVCDASLQQPTTRRRKMGEDFSFMKTGLLDADHQESVVDAIQFDMVSLFIKMVTIATENAETYCAHHGRHTVHSVDVVKSLRHQAKDFIASMTDTTLHEAREEMLGCLDEEDEEYSDDDEHYVRLKYPDGEEMEEEEKHPTPPRDEEKFEDDTKECDCELCTAIDTSSSTWSTYNPDDSVLQFLKAKVDGVVHIIPEEKRYMLGDP